MSLAAKRNKRYRKKKIVEDFRTKREKEKNEENKISADEIIDRIREVDDMKKCACCGKDTVNLVRV